MYKVICIFGHVLTVSCFAKNLISRCTFLKFHAHVEVNSARLFENVFKGLKSCIFKKIEFFMNIPTFFVR